MLTVFTVAIYCSLDLVQGVQYWMWNQAKQDFFLLTNTSNYVNWQSYIKMTVDSEHHNHHKEIVVVGALEVIIILYLIKSLYLSLLFKKASQGFRIQPG